jgi:DNA invertase Pin-like site-specific DNA recombinase
MPRIKASNSVTIYLRVSTTEQEKSGLGLDAQLEYCQRISSSLGLMVTGVFQDIVSGKSNPASREGFNAAIKNAQSVGGRLMVSHLDRMCRDVYYTSSFINGYMIKNSPKLLIADNPEASDFEINIRASMGQEERRLISERTKAALAVKKAQGYEIGKVGREVSYTKAIALTENAMIRAKHLRNDGRGYQEIANILNAEGFTTSRGSLWSKQAVFNRIK